MQDEDFSKMLDERINELSKAKKTVTENVLSGNWHAVQVQTAISKALDSLEGLSESGEIDETKELISLLNQVPSLVLSVWSNAVKASDYYEEEINRWKEMSAYYSQFMEIKKKEEQAKKKEEQAKKKEENLEEQIKNKIASGEIKEPTRMDSIRRQSGKRPGMSIAEYRKLATQINNEETTDADDSRG